MYAPKMARKNYFSKQKTQTKNNLTKETEKNTFSLWYS